MAAPKTVLVQPRAVEIKPRNIPRSLHIGRQHAIIMMTVYDMAEASGLTYDELTSILAEEVSRRINTKVYKR